MNTGFYGVFKQKYDILKKDLEKELKLAKSDRRKDWMKHHINQMKGLKDTLKQMEEHMGSTTCPNCGHKIQKHG